MLTNQTRARVKVICQYLEKAGIKPLPSLFMRSVLIAMLSSMTRRKLEVLITRMEEGKEVTLKERVQLHKYSLRYPMLAGKIHQALRINKPA